MGKHLNGFKPYHALTKCTAIKCKSKHSMSQRYDEIFLFKLNPKAPIFISCPNKLVGYSSVNLNLKADISQTIPSNISSDVEDKAILSDDNKGGMITCLSISQAETRYERSTFSFS